MATRLLIGDCREVLRTLPDESVHCVVTSPPYFSLRDYGVAGQIGLEPTPDAYVAEMVAVFRDVRRVLRRDGTLWLNLGDSYAANGVRGNNNGSGASTMGWPGQRPETLNKAAGMALPAMQHGLKPKDLIGIPWRVARALQEPYYTGRIKNETDRVWLAAMIDGEGCMFIHKRKIGQNNGQGYARKSDSYGAGLEVANCSKAITDRCEAITGIGSVFKHEKDRRQPLYRWQLRSNECRDIIREVYPYLVAKQHQARLLLACPSSGPQADAAHTSLIALHSGKEASIDFPAPASMYEPGWYLRQDIIWSKSNPMPESVTDRCTKAHEYVFLMARSERYFYDAAAIAELANYPEGPGNIRPGKEVGQALMETHANLHKIGSRDTRNRRSVWTVPSAPFSDAHFATFPPALIEPCILAGCPKGGVVLDPFSGAGTTGMVADRLQRDAILIELNPVYAAMSSARISDDAGMFANVSTGGD